MDSSTHVCCVDLRKGGGRGEKGKVWESGGICWQRQCTADKASMQALLAYNHGVATVALSNSNVYI